MTNASTTLPAIASLSTQPLCERALALEKFVHSLFFGRGMKKYRNALEATTLKLSRIAGRASIVCEPSRQGQLLDQVVEKLGDVRMTFQSFHDVDGIGDRELEQATTLLVAIESVAHDQLAAIETPGRTRTNGISAPDARVAPAPSSYQAASEPARAIDTTARTERTESIAAVTSVSLEIERTADRKKHQRGQANRERRRSTGTDDQAKRGRRSAL